MKATVSRFGECKGQCVSRYTLENAQGMRVSILDLGGIIQDLQVPDKEGLPHHCVTGFDTVEAYLNDSGYQGALVGRYANRIGQGRFQLDGVDYQLDVNGGEHHLHGGFDGFNRRLWQARVTESPDSVGVRLSLVSPAGDAGFPGEVTVTAEYRLYADNRLSLSIEAETTAPTPFSMTQHAYFRLSRQQPVTDNFLQVNADTITCLDATLLPTGDFLAVPGTPFDFRQRTRIGDNVHAGLAQFDRIGGYDHNFVLNRPHQGADAHLYAPDTGIRMALRTSFPGLQVYTGPLTGDAHAETICLEPQFFPDSPNKAGFPDCILRPGKSFNAIIEYVFTHA